jgi:pyruvate/2-oxoglutarate dehydrogenase complex dihydrolipoamide acyltransferase (E2) component
MAKVFVDRDTVNDESVIVRRLYKASGEVVDEGTLVLEYETSKTAIESYAPSSGVLSIAVKRDDEVAIGALLYEVTSSSDVGATPPSATAAASSATVGAIPNGPLPGAPQLSRQARQLAVELQVDVSTLPHSGWVTSADIRAFAGGGVVAAERIFAPAAAPAQAASPPITGAPDVPHRLARTSMRKRSEARLLEQANSPGTTSTLGMTLAAAGGRLVRPPPLFLSNISDIVIFETARLLKTYPELNAFYVDPKQIGLYEEVNIGVSFDGGSNLKVLAIAHADTKTLPQIQQEFLMLLDLYESDRPIPDQLLNTATVTISDLSGAEIDFMQPLINGRQSLILGITRAPGGFSFYASFDHRVSEGLQVSKFLQRLAANVSSYFSDSVTTVDLCCGACEKSMAEELALGHRGLIKIVAPNGRDGLLCRSCFEGF